MSSSVTVWRAYEVAACKIIIEWHPTSPAGIPTGAEPQAYLDELEANPGQPPQVEGGPPHFTGGMFQQVVVQ